MKKILITFMAFVLATPYTYALTLNLKNTSMATLINTVSQVTGKNFIVDPRVKGSVNIVSSTDIDNDEFYNLFLSILQVHGYIVVESENAYKILPQANTKYSARSTSSANDSIITTVIPIKNVAASQMIAILRPIISKYGHLAAYAPSNTIVVIDTRASLARLQAIIKQLDKEIDDDYELIPLTNASADEVSRIIKQLLPNKKNKSANPLTIAIDKNNNQLIVGGAPAKRLKVRFLARQLDKKSTQDSNISVIYLKYANAKDIAPVLQNISKQLITENKASKQTINIQADEPTNAIIITGHNKIAKSIKNIIGKLDIRRAQVLIEVIIAEISTENVNSLGIQWVSAGNNGVGLLDLTGSLPGLLAGIDSGNISAGNFNKGITLGGGKFDSDSGKGLGVVLNALKDKDNVNILSTPSIVTIDNQEATILVGEEVPVITNTQLNSSSTNPFQNLERKDIGIKLKVKPQINAGDSITLDIEQEISAILGKDDLADLADVRFSKRTIDTSVMVANNKILVLGGLMDDSTDSTESGVPILSDLPILGGLFKYSQESKIKRNLLVFIHPTILTDQAVADKISQEKYNFILAQKLLNKIDNPTNKNIFPNTYKPIDTTPSVPTIKENLPPQTLLTTPLTKIADNTTQTPKSPSSPPQPSTLITPKKAKPDHPKIIVPIAKTPKATTKPKAKTKPTKAQKTPPPSATIPATIPTITPSILTPTPLIWKYDDE